MATNFNSRQGVVGAENAVPQLARASTQRHLSWIHALKSKVAQSDALQKFSAADPISLLRNLRLGPLQRLAEVHVPFRLYRVAYTLGREHQSRFFAIDAVEGSLDLFEFRAPPAQDELANIETRNALPAKLRIDQSQELLREKVLRIVFQQGFFKQRDANLKIERIPLDFHLGYWLAFYGTRTARCRVLDATRNRIEGAKASALFESWLSE
jgi:hypothetical protein